jgi:hypothetical protein
MYERGEMSYNEIVLFLPNNEELSQMKRNTI